MAQVELTNPSKEYTGGKDHIVIIKDLGDLPGGRTLDVTGYTEDLIRAGHVVYKDGDGNLKPLPVSEGAYDSTTATAEAEYVGVVKQTVKKTDARVAILTIGQVNAGASPYPVTAAIQAGLPRIEFLYND